MKAECSAIEYMKVAASEEASGPDRDKCGAFTCALNIVSDIREYGMTSTDVEILHSLVDSICTDGHSALLSLIRSNSPVCEICEALAKRMDAK
ncbi:MAG: hypothetical protein K9J42_13975 [Sulfuritalea sp.]|nr:hypothetical protein [Sulfuritalea sp.]